MKHVGTTYIQLSTHGSPLANPTLAAELAEASLDAVKIPLYGPIAEIHEGVTQTKGSFSRATAALRNCGDLGVHVFVNSLVVRQNCCHLIDLFNVALEYTDWQNIAFSVPFIVDDAIESFYIPLRSLQPYVLPLVTYGATRGRFARFHEIPMCVFGTPYPYCSKGGPPDLGLQQPPLSVRSQVKDVPTYRLKKKVEMCVHCTQRSNCDGFVVNDVDRYGTGTLVPFS